MMTSPLRPWEPLNPILVGIIPLSQVGIVCLLVTVVVKRSDLLLLEVPIPCNMVATLTGRQAPKSGRCGCKKGKKEQKKKEQDKLNKKENRKLRREKQN